MRSTIKSWTVVLATSLFFFYVFIQMNLFNAINGSMVRDFGFSAQQISQLFASYFWGNVFFVIPAGLVLDRFSVKKTVIAAFMVAVGATYLFSIASNFQLLWFTRLLIGICGSFCFLGTVKMVSKWFSSGQMGLVTSVFVALANLGGVVAQTPLSLLTEGMGWRFAMQMLVLFGLFLVLLQIWLVEDKQEVLLKSSFMDVEFLPAFKAVLLNPQNWLAGLFISLLNFPSYVFGGSWGLPFLKQIHHFSLMEATTITSMVFIGMIIGSPVAGYYSDKIHLRKKPMFFGASLTLLILLFITYLPEFSFFSGIVLFLSLGFAMGFQVIGYPVITESNPAGVTATASSIGSMLIMGAGTLTAWYGRLLDLGGKLVYGEMVYGGADFLKANWFVLAGVIIALLSAICIKETFSKPYGE